MGGEEAQKEPKPDVEEGVGGEQAIDTCEGPVAAPELHSDALSLENMVMASGKLGGVAGVFLGVHIWGGEHKNKSKSGLCPKALRPTTCVCVCV